MFPGLSLEVLWGEEGKDLLDGGVFELDHAQERLEHSDQHLLVCGLLRQYLIQKVTIGGQVIVGIYFNWEGLVVDG